MLEYTWETQANKGCLDIQERVTDWSCTDLNHIDCDPILWRELLLTAVQRSFCPNCSVTEVAVDSAEYKTKLLTAACWISIPAALFLPSSVLPVNSAVMSSPQKSLRSFQSIFCMTELQVNSALFMAISVDRNLIFLWPEVPYQHAYFK